MPNNYTVLKFVALLAYNLLNKLIYGIFFEKRWNVALTDKFLKFDGDEIIPAQQLKNLPVLRNYNFYADPFFSCDGTKIRLEALRNKSGLGDLVEICAKDFNKQNVLASGQHYSYPFSFLFEENEYVLPEVASHSPQFFTPITGHDRTNHYIKGLEDKRLVDATLIEHDNNWFLFFGENQTALDILNLWLSDSPFGEFKPHPKTPIVMSPKTARMGGSVLKRDGRLLRFGQNNTAEYGESLCVLEVNKLTPTDYLETLIGSVRLDSYKGPHTINFDKNSTKMLLDYYTNEFSLFAGVRRLRSRFSKQ